jgi:3-phosphoglycerate kinase
MQKLSVRDLEVKGRRVLVRVDFNVPTEEIDGKIRITDDTRIRESLPTIELLRAKGAKVILLAHFGRPTGKPNLKYSLRPVADHLTQMIPPPVRFSPEVIGPSVEATAKALPEVGVLLVENVRFFPEEEADAGSRCPYGSAIGIGKVNIQLQATKIRIWQSAEKSVRSWREKKVSTVNAEVKASGPVAAV